ncbi:DUF3040 domain-containing protein [Actinoplanes auranticolor]|uniref:DUF3040 family protein n=1 Tax=Actinoplanes auranticolor TaxID=47988 RepID=A0A919VUP5_9ACTN|nr:DUF3040 domain-containing protein [Actinoplanes auranticolor]GIM70138.1 hypothetical protein Aau02nite_39570 [Actinoplanes auranticolor]
MPDNDESRAFARIVSQLRREDPRFAAGETGSGKRRGRTLLLIGIALCLTAVLLIAFGGPKGAVIAIAPWLAGLITVIRSRLGK